jgi:EpsI family protein
MSRRIFVLAFVLLVGASAVEWLSRAEASVFRAPLAELPMTIGDWLGRENPDFDPRVIAVLGVDDYINRSYTAAGVPVSLYVGYYSTQRTGATIHSPMKCLPGTGWQPLSTGRARIQIQGTGETGLRIAEINRYVVQKSTDRYLVMFWYQAHGHLVASEYAAKLRLMADAVRLNRTDGALVRLIVALPERESEASVEAAVTQFIQALFPLLERHLPS